MSGSSSPHVTPLFVFGALRSGTTLMRLMLKSHPAIRSPGEADYLFDYVREDSAAPDGWRYDIPALRAERIFRATGAALPGGLQGAALARGLVDTLAGGAPGLMSLNVHRNAPRMAALFPEARIIHLLRDPRDVARSSIGMGWAGNSYYGVDHWIATERGWDAAAIPAERVLTVRFETLMAGLEAELTRICAFLGLGFDPAMLDYHRNSTYGPPDSAVAGKWRRKASRHEIALIEGKAGPLMAARGYAPAGDPARPGPVEAAFLASGNRLRRWHFNMRRYGFGLFVGHHAARALGLRGLAGRLAARQEAIRVQHLQ